MKTAKPTLNDIYQPIQKELKEFSTILEAQLESRDPLIHAIHQHLLKMSGKFLRPAFTLFSYHLDNKKTRPEVVKLAVAIELIHTATLVHDDIIDNSPLRRNQPSVHSKWGREISIVSGDYIYAKAFLLLASLEDIWVNQAFAGCAQVICEGEMKQIEKRKDFLMSEEAYFHIIHQKTAALFQAACMGGAYFSGTTPTNIKEAGEFGFRLGMAFQIVDDCLDLIGNTENLGKTTGLDIYKNDVTLPLLYLFQNLGNAQKQSLLKNIQNGQREAHFEEVRQLCIDTGAVDKAMAKAKAYADEAVSHLEAFNPSPYKEGLNHLAAHCLERMR